MADQCDLEEALEELRRCGIRPVLYYAPAGGTGWCVHDGNNLGKPHGYGEKPLGAVLNLVAKWGGWEWLRG